MAIDFATVDAPAGFFGTHVPDFLRPGSGLACLRTGAHTVLAGTYPDGVTSVGAAPTSADVTVRVRRPGRAMDGVVVASTPSSAFGGWEIPNLTAGTAFDVYGRKAGYNDVVASDILPWVMYIRLTESGVGRETESGEVRITE